MQVTSTDQCDLIKKLYVFSGQSICQAIDLRVCHIIVGLNGANDLKHGDTLQYTCKVFE